MWYLIRNASSNDRRPQTYEKFKKFINENPEMHLRKQKFAEILDNYDEWVRCRGADEFSRDIHYSYLLFHEYYFRERTFISYM